MASRWNGRAFFFFLFFLGPRLGPSSSSAGDLPLPPSQLKKAHRFLPCSVVCHYVH